MEKTNHIKEEKEIANKELIKINQKIENKMQMNIINVEVNHIKFGKGLVTNFSNQILKVEFKGFGTKKLKYPEAFINNFLTCDNTQINEQTKELAQLYSEKTNLENKVLQLENELCKIKNEKVIKEKNARNSNSISNCMLAVLTGSSYTDDMELNLYYDKVRSGRFHKN